MPSIPLTGSPSPMAAPSGASGEGQAGQTGAGDAFAALLALLAGGGMPQGVLPGFGDAAAGSGETAQTAQAVTALSPAQTAPGTQLGVPLTIQGQLNGQDQGQVLSAQLLTPGGVQVQGQQPAQAGGLTGVPAVPTAVLLGGTVAPAEAALTAAGPGAALTAAEPAATTGTDLPAASGTTTEGVPVSTVPATGSGAGASTGEGGSGQPGSAATAVSEKTEVSDAAPQAVPNVTATAQTKAAEQVSAPASSRPAPPAAQVAMHILPLRQDPDGIHRLTVHLHPVDLGPISVVAELRNGAVHLQLAGASDAAFEALRSSLPDLKRELEDGGFSSCSLDLQREAPNGGQFGAGRQPQAQQDPAQQGGQGWNGDPYRGARTAPATADPVPERPGSRLLNVRL
ncbi:flagellar hook-length control protein FliK [Planobispora rosea]|nr:flagellar hook-length control protein FliK [Planobispora rosea]